MKKVIIVEDMPDAAQWLSDIVCDVFGARTQIQHVPTLGAARRTLASTAADLALVDLNLPDGGGHEFIQESMRSDARTICVVTTVYDDDAHLLPALRAGARGYLLKTDPRDVLIAQLQGILENRPPLSASVAQRIMQFFVNPEPSIEPLTEREKDVLRCIAQGLRSRDVADQLGVSLNTVSTHIKRVYAKLDISSRAEATLAAERMGMLDLPDT
ncbi:LuxR family transcriptional regulator [Oceanococcus atlanticus]|uniref:LuxR family transcriptional regulator n=1 Tax=Oceanococcus atlanticus TaxID=1317117 RepID=A0A1Y1SCE4_9GAMM|nr:response regulator transcription factor [Oceanococcus atlanticus]ORE85995.1 LuxR family transcriptional regulator [Oceanococcus atlanticus]RZO86187.1 MAG: response regulator transcription factor [Oceanococcus sp.]